RPPSAWRALHFVAFLGDACATSTSRTPSSGNPVAIEREHVDASDAAILSAAPSAPLSVDEPVLLSTDASSMTELESHGESFGDIAFGAKAGPTRALARSQAYRSLTARVAADLAALRASDPKSGVGMRYAHRLFDARWLESSDTRFELVAVVNRLDRRAFSPS